MGRQTAPAESRQLSAGETAEDARTHILDAAEALFENEGYRAASVRAITAKAGVNLAAINYYFGNKEALLEAVCHRRLGPLNEARLRKLKEIRAEARRRGRKVELQPVLRAFMAPALMLKESGGSAAGFPALFGRALADPDDTVQRVIFKMMKPVHQLMLEMMGDALPGVSREEVFWRYQFVIGAMARATRVYKNPGFKGAGLEDPGPEGGVNTLIDRLVSFTLAGAQAAPGMNIKCKKNSAPESK
ncbi:MAG: TetR family transcriptional regulator [Nitrospiraceae bacterium]|nr:TetR family transcriptional regulator [Nitrospiraceae bacterium]